MLLEELLGGLNHLEGSKVVSLLFEAGDDGTNESSLNAVGFDHDVRSLHA